MKLLDCNSISLSGLLIFLKVVLIWPPLKKIRKLQILYLKKKNNLKSQNYQLNEKYNFKKYEM